MKQYWHQNLKFHKNMNTKSKNVSTQIFLPTKWKIYWSTYKQSTNARSYNRSKITYLSCIITLELILCILWIVFKNSTNI